jgi:TrmH family RNA methyltransferase
MPAETIIRSRQNPIYKQIRSLLRRDRRHQERAFLVEGPRFVADAQRFGATPQMLVLSESYADTFDWNADNADVARIFDDELFASISDTVTAQGVIGVFPFPDLTPRCDMVPFLLIVDAVQDPGNLGTLIRSAAASGVTRFVALPGTADPWAPKTVRAAAAAHFVVPVESLTVGDLEAALPSGTLVLGADAAGNAQYDELDLSGPVALIVGAEVRGLSEASMALTNQLISIPLENHIESLNAGVAGSVLMFEINRQRRAAAKFTKTLGIS